MDPAPAHGIWTGRRPWGACAAHRMVADSSPAGPCRQPSVLGAPHPGRRVRIALLQGCQGGPGAKLAGSVRPRRPGWCQPRGIANGSWPAPCLGLEGRWRPGVAPAACQCPGSPGVSAGWPGRGGRPGPCPSRLRRMRPLGLCPRVLLSPGLGRLQGGHPCPVARCHPGWSQSAWGAGEAAYGGTGLPGGRGGAGGYAADVLLPAENLPAASPRPDRVVGALEPTPVWVESFWERSPRACGVVRRSCDVLWPRQAGRGASRPARVSEGRKLGRCALDAVAPPEGGRRHDPAAPRPQRVQVVPRMLLLVAQPLRALLGRT